MRLNLAFTALISSLFILLFSFCNPSSSAKNDSADIEEKEVVNLDRLIGKWQNTGRPDQWEMWEKTPESYDGYGMFVRGTDTTIFEKMQIVLRQGKYVFVAHVKNNPQPVEFMESSMESDKYEFANVDHDFPKYISYHWLREDLIEAIVSDGADREIVFQFKKVK